MKTIWMKSTILLVLIAVLSMVSCKKKQEQESGLLKGTINISGAFALYPLTVSWAEEFMKQNPEVRINVSAGGAGKGMADALTGLVEIGMFSRQVKPEEEAKGAYWVAVARDAVLPTINAGNPFLSEIKSKGLKRENFIQIFLNEKPVTWGELLGNNSKNRVEVFTRSDACGAAEMWGIYLGKDQESLKGTGVYGDPGIAEAVKNNIYSIGYNNVVYVYDMKTRKINNGLEVVPIDLNENGKVDSSESFYETLDNITNAIKQGIYPSPPARDLYFVFNGKPQNEVVQAFVRWVLTEGQKMVEKAGYVSLSEEKISESLKKLE